MAKRKLNSAEKLYRKLKRVFVGGVTPLQNALKFVQKKYKKLSKKQRLRTQILGLALVLVVGFGILSMRYNAGPPKLPSFLNALTGSTILDTSKLDLVDSSQLASDATCNTKKSNFAILVSDELQSYKSLLYKNLVE
ncbi:MAG: hypothetical protein ACON4M_09690, partial [Crocinitomicaceae bacterium]